MSLDPTSDLHRRHLAEQAEACLAQLWGSEPQLALHSRLAFEAIKELGEGGMGRVMRVRDRRIGREAALKLLSEDDPHLRARFQREAALMARLDHPNIPALFEAGVTPAGEPYILMRLIRGETLGDLIAARRTKNLKASELNALLDIFLKVLDAVDYAHSQGVIHRDIKPDNIMIGAYGEVLLMDWGIALDRRSKKDESSEHDTKPSSPRRARSQALTEEGAFIGTAGYAAPEQVEGIPVDERADVFALGVLLVELLSGRPAVPGDTTLEKVIATQEGPILGPRAHGVPIDASLDWIISTAFSVDREQRTPSVRLLREQILAYRSSEAIPHYPEPVLHKLRRTLRRHSAALLLTSALLLFLTLGIALESSQQRAEHLRQQAEQNRLEAEKASVLRRAAERKSQSDLAAAEQAEAQKRRLEATQSALAEARDLERRGASREAIMKQVELALSSSARSAPTLLSAAELLLEMGQQETACRLLEEAAVEPPTAYRALTLLHGLEQARTGRLRTAYVDRLVEMARARGDRNEMTLFADAHLAFETGDFEGCLKLTTEVQRMVEPWAGLWVLHGNALVRLGRMKESLEAYAKALELEPGHRLSRANRATVLFKLGRTDEAEAELKILLREDPKDATALASLGAIARLRGQFVDSVPLLERACQLDPDHDEAFVNLLLSLLATGRIDELESWFQKLYPRLAARPLNSEETRRLRGDALELVIAARLERGDGAGASSAVAEALSILDEPQRQPARRAWLLSLRGMAKSLQGKLEEGVADQDLALSLSVKTPKIYFNRASLHFQARRFEQARADFLSELATNPDDIRARCNLAQTCISLDLYDEALLEAIRARRADPSSTPALYFIAEALARLDRHQEALRIYKKIARESPGFSQLPTVMQRIALLEPIVAKELAEGNGKIGDEPLPD